MIDSRVLPLKRGQFRSKLCFEDVRKEGMDIYQVTNKYNRVEKVAIGVHSPIKIPFVNFYRNKISNVKDTYLLELVEDMMFFNIGIDPLGIKKMTEFLLKRVVRHVDGFPVISFEALHPKVEAYVQASMYKQFVLLTDAIVFFETQTMLSSEERREISVGARSTRGNILNGELIHNAAITAIKVTQRQLQITKPRVLEQVDDHKIKTVATLTRHIRQDTVDLLTKANTERHFKTEATLEKYQKFLELPQGILTRDAADKLKVSLSTINQFKKIKD